MGNCEIRLDDKKNLILMENVNLSPKKNQIIFSRNFSFGIFFPAWSDVSPTEDSAKLVSLSLDLSLSW